MSPLPTELPRIARYAPDGLMAPHRHDEDWFCVVLQGAYEERVRSRAALHSAGHMLFCPAGAEHAQRFGGDGAVKLLFRPAPSGLDYLKGHRVPLPDAPYVRAAAVAVLGTRIARELKLADSHAALAVEGLLLELIAAFARSGDAARERAVPAWLARAREILEDEAGDAPTLADLAVRVGRHPVHLAKAFRRHYGRTVGDYLREKRAANAALLLRASALPLTEIALSCGYAGSAAFSRGFRAVYGLTPSAYRAAAR